MSRLATIVRQIRRTEAPDETEATFAPGGHENAGEIVALRLRRPIMLGSIVVLILVLGLLIWAAVSSVAGAVLAAGSVRVEGNAKTLRHREGGIVRHIYVREGQRVRRGQILMRLDPVQTQAGVDVYQSVYDTALANAARAEAESRGLADVNFPAELLGRANQPQIRALIESERALFRTRMAMYRSQAVVMREQARQLETQITGLRAQVVSVESQSRLVGEEMGEVRALERQGYAPRSRVLGLERTIAATGGQRGQLVSDIGRTQQAIGGIRLQIAQLDDRRQTEAAQNLRDAQDKLTDAAPKLRATTSSLQETTIRSPADGYVFNLTQYTEGGVAQPGEPLMQIVPADAPMIISARVPPNDISDVHVNQPARITLTAYNPRTTPQIDGTVILVGADVQTDELSKASYYQVQVRIDPAELAKAGPKVRLTPGMPVNVAIVTGSRTILDYLLSPLTDAMRQSLRER